MISSVGRLIAGAMAVSTAFVLAACGGATQVPSVGQSGQNALARVGQPAFQAGSRNAWVHSLTRTPLPGAGCYKASFPSMAWSRIACSTPPHLLYPVPRGHHHGIQPNTVGDGNDYTANTAPNVMSSAIGSFPAVTGVTSVKSVENPAFGAGGDNGTNSYTLQLNSSFFSTAACNGESNCAGWEQFVYENPPGTSKASLFIQDWLIPANLSGSIKCPKSKGWESADGGCVQNSASSVSIPNQSITKLGSMVETGDAASSGDSVYLAVGSTMYGMKVQSDSITDLAANWTGAEFNVIGNAGGDVADFNSGSSITVRLETNTGKTTAPSCPANSGTTGESNNLNFGAAPSNPTELSYPSIEFTMSSSASGTASCDAIPAN
jgi:hypothetical protein